MKHFLFIPSCALLALGILTSCQKEDKTAQQLADELTAELQKVTDYKSAEAAAPRVEVLNKRFQNASVRVFSAGSNALADSSPTGYAESVGQLAKQIGRVRASKPVAEAEGDVDEARLIAAVGVAAGAAPDAAAKDRSAKGTAYLHNTNSKENNTPPALAECYGSAKLKAALEYTADVADFPATRFDSDADVPEIPAAVDVADDEEAAPEAEESSAAEPEETPAADTGDAADEEETPAADAGDAADEEEAPAAGDAADEDSAPSDDEDAASGDSDADSGDDDDAGIDIEL
ncbi:MAG: hypothetical protein ACI4OS_00795 [Akkermansia sp.]